MTYCIPPVLPPYFHFPHLHQYFTLCYLRILSQGRVRHCPTTHLTTYPGSTPFPKVWSLPCGFPLVSLISVLPQDESRGACHILDNIQVHLQADPLKHSYHCSQRCLHPDRILSFFPSVICVKSDVVFPRRQIRGCEWKCLLRPLSSIFRIFLDIVDRAQIIQGQIF